MLLHLNQSQVMKNVQDGETKYALQMNLEMINLKSLMILDGLVKQGNQDAIKRVVSNSLLGPIFNSVLRTPSRHVQGIAQDVLHNLCQSGKMFVTY